MMLVKNPHYTLFKKVTLQVGFVDTDKGITVMTL